MPRGVLIEKLKLILRWIYLHLTDRYQHVVFWNGESSLTCKIIWSSSRICPWAATDISDSVEETTLGGNSITLHTYYYADDMLLFRVIQSAEDFSRIQEGINNIGRWVEGNYLKLNSSKC